MVNRKQLINSKKIKVILMEKNIINQIENKFKAMSFPKLIMLAIVVGGIGAPVFVFTRDILNMFS